MISQQGSAIEGRRQELQISIDSQKSAASRNRLGQFATPNGLAQDIARYVVSLMGKSALSVHFADPAVGSGSFFSAAVNVLGSEKLRSAVGIEIDQDFANAAKSLWSDHGLNVILGDFTKIVASPNCPAAPNLVLANPPYVRHHHFSTAEKERLQQLVLELTGVKVNGLAGLYVYFLLLTTAWMQPEGMAAWLIPSECMDVNYGAALRTFLTNNVTLIRAHRFDPIDVQFDDALVSSVVLVFKKSLPPHDHEAMFTFGGSLHEPSIVEHVSSDVLRQSRKWTSFPRHVSNDRQPSGEGVHPTLSDLFRIQRGVATGNNRFFILDRETAAELDLPTEYLRPILPSPRNLKTTIVDADEDGFPCCEPALCLIDCDLPETTLKQTFPALWKYLDTAAIEGVLDGYLVGKRKPWYRQEQRLPAPFLCTYMGRSASQKQPFRFIWNRSQAIATNLYLMLYPQKHLLSLIHDDSSRLEAIFQLLREVTGHELRGEGRVYGGGLNKIEPRELGRISAVPFISRWPQLARAIEIQPALFD